MAGKTGAKRGGKRGKSGNKAVAQSVSHKAQNTQHAEPFRVKELRPDEVFMTELIMRFIIRWAHIRRLRMV